MSGSVHTHDDLRTAWNEFFKARDHAIHPSASLVPANDPTLLFTGAGMNQFKDMFLGKGNLPFRRAATIQKCFRQGDLDNVGRTPRHLTFFEMLGHFSFGDYFKAEAIPWAWTFLTEVLALDPKRLVVSVHEEDDEALAVWRSLGVADSHIGRFNAAENYWPADAPKLGPNGPCGPCTEIFFDYGPAAAKGDGGTGSFDSGRYVEIWNTVFTQYERVDVDRLVPLPQRNIDCGAGLERIVAALEGQQSPFGTSLFRPLVAAVASLAGVEYRFDPKGAQTPGEDARRVRRIAEHARASCFLVADGVRPGNEGRGYVLRRVLRRGIRDGIQLGLEEPFLHRLVGPVLDLMGQAHPNLVEGKAILESTFEAEEQRFRETYRAGLKFLDEELAKAGQGKVFPGEAAFRLHDTYGFPLDLAELILSERGLTVDQAGFDHEMEAQRRRARAGSKMKGDIFAGGPLTELKAQQIPATIFAGHAWPGVAGTGRVLALIDASGQLVDALTQGCEGTAVLDQTPFYAESGGQIGDRGSFNSLEATVEVSDVQRAEGWHLHRVRVLEGALRAGQTVDALVDATSRDATRRNHTATHLLHEALRSILGSHVQQEGSLVEPGRLRFDFRHPRPVTREELEAIEAAVSRWVLANDDVDTNEMDLEAAKASGAMALFGEKYDAKVRVVSVASGSRELCGGTHCRRTGDIGFFQIAAESGIAAGVRRIEALTGEAAAAEARKQRGWLRDVGFLLKAKPEQVPERVAALQEELKEMRKQAERAARDAGADAAKRLAGEAEVLSGLRAQFAALPATDAKGLKSVAATLEKAGIDVVVLVGESGGRAPIYVGLSPAAEAGGLDARQLLAAAAGVLGGGGGGRPSQAQGQGTDPSQAKAALAAAREAVLARP